MCIYIYGLHVLKISNLKVSKKCLINFMMQLLAFVNINLSGLDPRSQKSNESIPLG